MIFFFVLLFLLCLYVFRLFRTKFLIVSNLVIISSAIWSSILSMSSYRMFLIAALTNALSTHLLRSGLVFRINFISFYVKFSFVEKYLSKRKSLDRKALFDLSSFLEISSAAKVASSESVMNLYLWQFFRNSVLVNFYFNFQMLLMNSF